MDQPGVPGTAVLSGVGANVPAVCAIDVIITVVRAYVGSVDMEEFRERLH